MSQTTLIHRALEQGQGVLRLAPNWVPRSFCIPGRRIKLHPDDKVDAVVMSVTDFAQAQNDDGMLQAGLLVGSAASAGWGLRKEDTALRQALDEFLRSLLSSGSWNPIVLKYFNKDALDLIARGRR